MTEPDEDPLSSSASVEDCSAGHKNSLTPRLIDVKWPSVPGVIVTEVKTYGCGFGREYVYCYTYPTYLEMAKLKQEDHFRIKVGMASGDPIARIRQQIAGSVTALSESPIALLFFQTLASRHLERWFHERLERVDDAIGSEWFYASLNELITLFGDYLCHASNQPDEQPVLEARVAESDGFFSSANKYRVQRNKDSCTPYSFAKMGPATSCDDVLVFVRRHRANKKTADVKSERVRRFHLIENLMEKLGRASVQQLCDATGYSEFHILEYANWSVLRRHSRLEKSLGDVDLPN